LTLQDAEALADPFAAPSVQAVSPVLQTNTEVTYGGEIVTTSIIGALPSYFSVQNINVTEGEMLNEEHILGRASVAVIGPETADTLFGWHDGVTGQTIRIGGQPFRIIGVLESKGGSAFGSQDDRVVIPLTSAQTRLVRRGDRDEVDIIFVQAASAEQVPQASQEVTDILSQRHRNEIGEPDFTVFSQQDFLSTAATITGF
jgi:putative ABC transport system permease protein